MGVGEGGGCDIDVIVQKEQKQSVVACRGVVFFAKLFAQVFHSNSSTPKYTLGLQQYVVALTQNQLLYVSSRFRSTLT